MSCVITIINIWSSTSRSHVLSFVCLFPLSESTELTGFIICLSPPSKSTELTGFIICLSPPSKSTELTGFYHLFISPFKEHRTHRFYHLMARQDLLILVLVVLVALSLNCIYGHLQSCTRREIRSYLSIHLFAHGMSQNTIVTFP
jgi:hypothetical protein